MKVRRKERQEFMKDSKAGFTIVELTLTMAFIAMLLIAIAVITTNILAIYQKGTTLKAVNNTGRDLIDSFSNSLADGSSFNVTSECAQIKSDAEACNKDNGFKGFTFNEYRDSDGNQLYGVFCTGTYSYIWNTEYTLRNNDTAGLTLRYVGMDDSDPVKTFGGRGDNKITLARVLDSRRRVCSATVNNSYESVFPDTTEINVTHYLDNSDRKLKMEDPEGNLLNRNDVNLALYELTVFPYSNDKKSGHNFYSGTFILGTERGDIDIQSSGEFCKNSETSSLGNLGAEFNYCAINKFNFAVRSAGE